MGSVPVEVVENQVDGLTRVFGGAAPGTLGAKRIGEPVDGGANIVELAGRCGGLVFEPQNVPEPVEQIGAFLQDGAGGGTVNLFSMGVCPG
jgi:hypothetical protein